jgi:ribosomal protein L37E
MKPLPKSGEPGAWPYYQMYVSECRRCGQMFYGPKRAPCCWECVDPKSRADWNARWGNSPVTPDPTMEG